MHDSPPPSAERPTLTQEGDSTAKPDAVNRYWRTNLSIVGGLLSVWGVVSFGCGILWIEPLNQIRLGQVGLGFWIAQQGAIFVFVILVTLYAFWMDRVDRKHDVGDLG